MGSNIVASESLNMSGDIYNVNGKIHAVVDLNLSGKNLYNITTENKDGWQYKDIAQEKANIKADMKEKEYLLVSQKEEKAPSQNSNKNDTLEESAPKEDTTEEQPESQPTQTEPQPEDKKGITLDHRAEISSDGNMNISMSETLLNRAGDIYSAGNLNIEAKSILLDTIVMETSTNYSTGDSKNSYSKETYHLQNEVATLGSGGNMSVKTQDNFTSIGGKINVGGSAKLEIGGNFSMEGVYDYDYEKETTVSTKTKKKFGVKINSTKTTEELESEQYTANKGSFNVGGDLNIISENNITLKGVDLNVGGSAGMYAGYKLNEDGKLEESGYKGDVNIFHMEDISNSNYSKTVEKKGFTKDSLKGALNSVKDMGKSLTTCMACKVMQGESLHGAINDSFSGLNMEISMGYKDKTNIREESKTIVKSEIKTGGNLTMQSTGDMIQLSDVDVGGNYTRMAEGKIIDYEAHDTYNITQNHEREEVKFTMGIGNSYVDAANALNNVNEARKDVNQATSDLAQAEKDYAAGKISAAALNEARTMLAFATGNFANSTIGAAGSYGGAAGACATSLCTGLYANTGVKYQYSSSSSNDWSKTSVGSNVSVGGNMNIISDNYSKTGGSIDVAGDINFEVKHNLELHAGTNTYGGSSFDKNWELGVSGSTAGTASFNGSYSKSEDSYHGTTYDNLQIHAGGNINQSVGGDYLGQGVNMRAEGTLNQDIKGDKILESLQNEYESKGNSWGIRGGFSSNMTTGGIPQLSGVNGGFNLGSSKEYSKITNQASSETAGEGVYITVGGKFTNIGSIVANTDKDG
ncbi:MAG: hemagglutinin repeat-containing protein, partial [Alphaproteobacteria bacterium]|nr:hemagglutinin repeat-containing protein [Alphaproteobacteria bacterium]